MGGERVEGGGRKGREGGRALPPTVSSNNAYGYKGYADIRWGPLDKGHQMSIQHRRKLQFLLIAVIILRNFIYETKIWVLGMRVSTPSLVHPGRLFSVRYRAYEGRKYAISGPRPSQTPPPSVLRRFAPPCLARDLRSLHRRPPKYFASAPPNPNLPLHPCALRNTH